MTIEQFIEQLKEKGIELSAQQLAQFALYYELLVEWNEKMNLTAITEQSEVYLKHFYDCLMPLWLSPLKDEAITLCDVGAGAGFPSIPLKIMCPQIQLTIVDSLNKRIQFLEHLVSELGLEQVRCVHGRAEEVGQNQTFREQFDVVTARAVASLNVLSEYCLPLVKKGGYFMALKAQKSEEEMDTAKKAITLFGAKFDSYATDFLPIEQSERTIILIKKTKETPNKYPRRAGLPAKKPIQ